MLGLADALLEAQDQRRHQNQYGCQAAYNALGQYKAQVPANGKAHQRQGHKAHDGGDATGYNGIHCLVKRCRHGLLVRKALLFLGGEAVQQEDGVIHRHRQLDHRCNAVGEEGDPPEDDVGAHIEDNGDPHSEQEQHRFKPGGRRQGQYSKNDHYTGCHDHRHLAGDTLLEGLVVDGRAAVMSFFSSSSRMESMAA